MSDAEPIRLDPTAPPGPVMSRCVIFRGMAYIAGMTAADLSDDTAGQTRQVLRQIDGYLARAGSGREHVLTVQIWLADMSDFADMNGIWNAWVGDRPPPARACVSGELFRPDARVEIMVTAVVP